MKRQEIVGVGVALVLALTALAAEAAGQHPPTVRQISFDGLPEVGDTYGFGEPISVRIRFSEAVSVTGRPRLTVAIGSQTRLATYRPNSPEQPPNRSDTHYFRYDVTSWDRDTDGISMPANAFRLNDGAIRAVDDGSGADLTHRAIAHDQNRKVDGRRVTPPAVSRISFLGSPVSGGRYERGEYIVVGVVFSRSVAIRGSPQVALTIGGRTRMASYYSSPYAETRFRYAVQEADRDDTGISIAANSLSLNGGSIEARVDGVTPAGLDHIAVASSVSRRVDGSRVSVPRVRQLSVSRVGRGTYELGETVSVCATFTRGVRVAGTPQVALTIGDETRLASYVPGGPRTSVCFRYTVQAADVDSNGISLAANALRLNGGTIKSVADGVTDADLSHAAVASTDGTNVDGRRATAPRVDRIYVLPRGGGTYGLGSEVTVRVEFDQPVTITGVPVFELTVGSRTRLAAYDRGYFSYRVQADDLDRDGISIPANALRLNNGRIAKFSDRGVTDAVLSHDPVTDDGTRVDGRLRRMPKVSRFSFLAGGRPLEWEGPGRTFQLGETISVLAHFSGGGVRVSGRPRLALTIGDRTRLATYSGGSFKYRVRAADRDAVGIGIPANAFRLNGGTIKAAEDDSTDAVLEHAAVPRSSRVRVDGGRSTALRASVRFHPGGGVSTNGARRSGWPSVSVCPDET